MKRAGLLGIVLLAFAGLGAKGCETAPGTPPTPSPVAHDPGCAATGTDVMS